MPSGTKTQEHYYESNQRQENNERHISPISDFSPEGFFASFHCAAIAGQTIRSNIFFLISAMALAGFNPLGQVFVQFMMV